MYENQSRDNRAMSAGIAQYGSISALGNTLEPREPGPTDRAREIVSLLNELEGVHSEIRVRRLYGPAPKTDDSLGKIGHEPCLDELLLTACQKVSMAVSEARSILSRL